MALSTRAPHLEKQDWLITGIQNSVFLPAVAGTSRFLCGTQGNKMDFDKDLDGIRALLLLNQDTGVSIAIREHQRLFGSQGIKGSGLEAAINSFCIRSKFS